MIILFKHPDKMSSFSPLSALLKNKKLTGPNFIEWEQRLDIVLIAEDYKYVLTTPCPVVRANSSKEQKDAEAKWQKANSMAKCYMLGSMSDILRSKHKHFDTAKEIMTSLS